MQRRPLARYLPPLLLIATCTGCFEEKGDTARLAGDMTVPTGPDIDVDPGSVDFGYVLVGETGTVEILVCNQGTEDLHVQDVALATGVPFAVSGTPLDPVAAGECASFDVTFTPESIDTFDDTLTISSDDGDEPAYDVALHGQGVGED